MATALDLLMSAKEDVNLLSEQSDICTIDAKTRIIFVPSTIVVGGVQSDKNAERIKFSCPKIVGDNLDLSKFSVRINFENVSSVDFNVSIKDQYICDDVAVDGENVTFSWLIGRNAARYMGTVRFIVCAVKTDSDSNISVEWNTTIAEVPVLEGIEIDQPQIGQEEKDVINQLLELTKNTSAEAVQNVNSAKEQAIKNIQSVSQPDTTLTIEGGLAEAKATGEAIGSLKADITTDKVNTKITANNKIVKNNLTHGLFINAFGEKQNSDATNITENISVEGESHLYFVNCGSSCFYSSDGSVIERFQPPEPSGVVEVPSNAKYIIVTIWNNHITDSALYFGEKNKIFDDGYPLTENIIDSKIFEERILDRNIVRKEISRNLFNKADIEKGVWVSYSTGATSSTEYFDASNYIEIFPSIEKYHLQGIDNQQLALYDKNKKYIGGYVHADEFNNASENGLVDENARYIRFTIPRENNWLDRAMLSVGVIDIPYESGVNTFINEQIETVVEIGKEFANLRVCLEIIKPSKNNKYTVLIPDGIYDIRALYTESEIADSDFRGLFVPNYCKLKGIGSREDTILKWDNPTTSEWISTLHLQNTCELENITVIANRIRYAVHDDYSWGGDEYYHRVKNCIFKATNGQYDKPAIYGSGFNTGKSGGIDWIFENCEFVSDDNKTFAFLNHNNVNINHSSCIIFDNCRFRTNSDRDIQLSSLNTGVTGKIYVTLKGCYLKSKKIVLLEAEGKGIKYNVDGYANNVTNEDVIIESTDEKDYSKNIDLI